MATLRAQLAHMRALGPHEASFAEFLMDARTGFIEANQHASLPVLAKGRYGYGLHCGSQRARFVKDGDQELFRVPPPMWLPFCADLAVKKAEIAAPDFLAKLRLVEKESFGGRANEARKRLTPVVSLALEILFELRRDGRDASFTRPYLKLLWEASSSNEVPHPLLMGPELLAPLQASPLVAAITAAVGVYRGVHTGLFGNSSPVPADAFLWSLGLILSRAVSGPEQPLGLLPFLDMVNHGDEPNCILGFDPQTSCHTLTTLRPLEAGEELLIDYGVARKGLYQSVRTYGFASLKGQGPHGQMDVVLPSLSSCMNGRGDPQGGSSTMKPLVWSLPVSFDSQWTDANFDVSYDVVAWARGSCSNSGEVERYGDRLPAQGLEQKVGVEKLDRPAGESLVQVLSQRLQAYDTTLEEDSALKVDGGAVGQKEVWDQLCLEIRMAEKRALERARDEVQRNFGCMKRPGFGTQR